MIIFCRDPIAAAIDQNNVIPSTPSLEDMETQGLYAFVPHIN